MNRLAVVAARALPLRGGSSPSSVLSKFSFSKPHTVPTPGVSPAAAASRAKMIYDTFLNTNAKYVTVVLVTAIVGEQLFCGAVDSFWKAKNGDKLFEKMIRTFPADE